MLPAILYRKLGVDTTHLRAILTIKLLMDDRRPNTLQQTRQSKNKKQIESATLGIIFMSFILGAALLLSFSIGKDYITHLTFYFSFYIFFLAATLITDFTSVLIDVRDNLIILPKPVNDRTVVFSRILHILIHLTKLVVPMTAPAMIWMAYYTGLSGMIAFDLLLILATLLSIFIINAVYLLILQITTPQKFAAIISYLQIFFAILIYGGYQVIPRMADRTDITQFSITEYPWIVFLTPYWFAASWEFLWHPLSNLLLGLYFIGSLLIPLASIWIVLRYFAPSFNQKLSQMGGSQNELITANPKNSDSKKARKITYSNQLAAWFTDKGAERMSFLLTWKLTSREREFKIKVYPSFGYMLVYFILIFVTGNRRFSMAALSSDSGNGKFLFVGIIYVSSLLLIMALKQIIFSEKYKAAWMYYSSPLDTPGKILSGAVKAVVVKFYLPIALVTFLVASWWAGLHLLPNLILGLSNELFISFTIAYITLKEMPFSVQPSTKARTGSFMAGLFNLAIPGLLATLHFLIYTNQWLVMLLGMLSILANWLMIGALKNRQWDTLYIPVTEK